MNARLSTNGLMQQLRIPLVLFVLGFLSVQHVAYAARLIDKQPSLGAELALLTPSAYPYALPANAGKQTVRISVPVRLTGQRKVPVTVYLRRSGTNQSLAMNDLGKKGDFISKDGIHGVYVQIDTDKVKPDSCLYYEAFIKQGRSKIVSPPVRFCVSSFPVGIAKSNTDKPVVLHDGGMAVADEVVLYATPKTSAAALRELASSINARVVGSILPLNLYQLKLPSPVNAEQLLGIVARLRGLTSSVGISVNLLGQGALHINDTDFNSQHGLRLVVEQDQHGIDSNAWDAGGTGNGVTVVVLDTGLESSHPDLDATWTCQNVPLATAANSISGILTPPVPVLLIPCTDTTVGTTPAGHGTEVAGVIAARTNNNLGIAGIASGSRIHSISLRDFTLTGMTNGFITAAGYVGMNGNAKVINASFAIEATPGSALGAGIPSLCTAINSAVSSGLGSVVVNAVGNNSNKNAINLYSENFYPARCNDSSNVAHAGLVNKSLLITVSNSTSGGTCGSVDQLQSTSNYGAWVDIAAPGCDIRTTTRVGTGTGGTDYINVTGNSFSAPLVAGAAAILASCGVPLSQIETTLKGPPEGSPGANVYVPYPIGSSVTKTPRLDVYHALQAFAPSASNLNAAESYTEDTPLNLTDIVIASNLSACATITATLSLPVGAGALTTGTSGAVTSTFSGGVWRAAGALADVNTLLAAVTFNPASNYNGTFNIATSVSDGLSAINGSKVMTGMAVNDAPINTVPATQVVTEDIAKVISGIGVDDVDAGATAITMTLTAAHGMIGVNTAVAGGVTAPNITGNNSASITLAGSQSQINATLADAVGVTYTPSANYNGAAILTVQTNDNGASGSGGALIDSDNIAINITAVNDAPETNVATGSGLEDIAPITVALSGSDIDGTVASFNIVSGPVNGVLYSDAAMSMLISAGGSVAATGNAAIVYYKPAANFNGTDTFIYAAVDDLGLADATPAAANIGVTAVNDPLIGTLLINPPEPTLPATRHVGDMLTANVSGLTDADCPTLNIPPTSAGLCTTAPCDLGYQWQSSASSVGAGVDILGASNREYHLSNNDVGKFMSLCVSTGSGADCSQRCSVSDATAVGDPHITTVDGLHYDFQSAGEFVALRGANGMEIQTRHTPVSTASAITDPYSGLTSGVSINTAVAARVGHYRVTLQSDPGGTSASASMVLRVDGVLAVMPANGLALGAGGHLVKLPGGAIQVDFPNQTTMVVTPGWWAPHNVWYLNVSVMHTSAYVGLMGARGPNSWLPRLADGSSLGAMPAALPDRYVDLYEKFADSWRVSSKASLFDYAPDTSTRTYTYADWPKRKPPFIAPRGPVAQAAKQQVALRACRAIRGKAEHADCVFDVMVTGHAGFAQTYLLSQRIQAGLTHTSVQDDKATSKDKETVIYTATVERNTTAAADDSAARVMPTGAVQFVLGDSRVGEPVKIDKLGQARVKLPKLKVGSLSIVAHYLPAKGSVFLPSSSLDETLKLSR